MSYSCRALVHCEMHQLFCLCLSDERGAPALLFQVRWPAGQDELGSRGQPDPGSQAGSRGSHPAEELYLCERCNTFAESFQEHERNPTSLFIVLNPPVFVVYIVFFSERAGVFHQWWSLSQPVWVAVAIGASSLKSTQKWHLHQHVFKSTKLNRHIKNID